MGCEPESVCCLSTHVWWFAGHLWCSLVGKRIAPSLSPSSYGILPGFPPFYQDIKIRPYCEVLGVKTSTYEVWGTNSTRITEHDGPRILTEQEQKLQNLLRPVLQDTHSITATTFYSSKQGPRPAQMKSMEKQTPAVSGEPAKYYSHGFNLLLGLILFYN